MTDLGLPKTVDHRLAARTECHRESAGVEMREPSRHDEFSWGVETAPAKTHHSKGKGCEEGIEEPKTELKYMYMVIEWAIQAMSPVVSTLRETCQCCFSL